MAKKIAIFSNGHRDEYKGRRDVKAAWMLITPNGGITSGHSLDRSSAENTASSAISNENPHSVWGLNTRRPMHQGQIAYYTKMARDAGFDSIRAYKAYVAEKSASFRASCKIEIVDLVEA